MNNIFLINKFIEGYKFRSVFNAIKFSFYFSRKEARVSAVKLIKQILWICRSLFKLSVETEYSFLTHNTESTTIKGRKLVYATINTTDAVHYKIIESNFIELINVEVESRDLKLDHLKLAKNKTSKKLNPFSSFVINCNAFYIILSFLFKTIFSKNKEIKRLVLHDIDYLYVHIVKYLTDYKNFKAFLCLNRPDFLLTINENWEPQSTIVECCKDLKIPTVLYPHGIIGDVNLPIECDTVLFWNNRMKSHYEPFTQNIDKNFVVGAIEPLGNGVYNDQVTLEYDVLIISQLMVADDGEHVIFKDIFRIWNLYLEQNPNFRICIKLHPFEGENEIRFLTSLFDKNYDKVTIIQGRDISISGLIIKSKRISTVSSSSIQHCFHLGRPVLLYAPTKQLEQNFPIPENWTFRSLKELNEVLEQQKNQNFNTSTEEYMWAQESYVRRNIKLFVDSIVSK